MVGGLIRVDSLKSCGFGLRCPQYLSGHIPHKIQPNHVVAIQYSIEGLETIILHVTKVVSHCTCLLKDWTQQIDPRGIC